MADAIVTVPMLLDALGIGDSATAAEQRLANIVLAPAHGACKRFLRYDPVSATRTEYLPSADDLGDSWWINDPGVWDSNGVEAFFTSYGGSTSDQLQVTHIPIRSITTIHEDVNAYGDQESGDFPASTLLTSGTHYYHDIDTTGLCKSGIIYRRSGSWSDRARTIKVVYVAGYTMNEFQGMTEIDASPIQYAVLETAVYMFKRLAVNQKKSGPGFTAGPLLSEKLGDYMYRLSEQAAGSIETMGLFAGDLPPESARLMLSEYVHTGLSPL